MIFPDQIIIALIDSSIPYGHVNKQSTVVHYPDKRSGPTVTKHSITTITSLQQSSLHMAKSFILPFLPHLASVPQR
jgi:hypothetical protein